MTTYWEERESSFGTVGLRTASTIGYDCLRVTTFVIVGYDFASALGYDCLRVSEWMSEWVWEGKAKGCSSEWVSLNFEDFVMSRLKVLWICFYFVDFESYKLDIYVAPRCNFVQLRVSQKHWTRALETWVLKTRDASFTHTFKTGQLTKLLEYYCYLERVFGFLCFFLIASFSISLRVPGFSVSLGLF